MYFVLKFVKYPLNLAVINIIDILNLPSTLAWRKPADEINKFGTNKIAQ